MSNITEPQRSEEVRRQIEDRFCRLVEVMPVAVYVCDTTGIIQSYNERAVELWGREPRPGDPAQRHLRLIALLRVLQDRQVERVGGSRAIPVDVSGGTWSTTASRRRSRSSSPAHERRPPWPQTRTPWGR
jgi:PAS domain-containing protein